MSDGMRHDYTTRIIQVCLDIANIADYPEDDIGCDCCEVAMKANDFCSRGEKREVTT